jgi:hypothetical protein
MIEQSISYVEIFQMTASKIIPLLRVFEVPQILWSLINMLSFLLEKNVELK